MDFPPLPLKHYKLKTGEVAALNTTFPLPCSLTVGKTQSQKLRHPSKCEEICVEKRGLPAEVSTKRQTKPSPPPLLLPNTHQMPFHLCHSQQLYFQKHLAQTGRKEEKKDKCATLSIRMGWQYHSKPRESTSILTGFRSLWFFRHQLQVILMPAGSNVTVTSPHNTGRRTSLNLIPVSN